MTAVRVVLTAALGLAGLAASVPSATAVEDPPATTTVVTFSVVGCDGCTISSWLPNGGSEGEPNGKAKVRNGKATLSLPTALTTGTSFQLDPAQDPYMNAVTLIVFQYKGAEPGSRVTRAQAQTYRRGSACWAGTTQAAAQIAVRVRYFWAPAFDPLAKDPPKRARQPIAWVVPTQQSAPPYWPVTKGALQAQNTPDCMF